MLIAHSSAASTRYKLDILRALILPMGAHLTFRYDKKYLPGQLAEEFEKNSIRDQKVVISSLFDDSVNQSTAFIPIRFAEIVETKILGTMCLLVMRLGGFAVVGDDTLWTNEIQKLASNLPAYKAGKLQGMFCERLSSNSQTLREIMDMTSWTAAITRLQKIPTYASEPYFYCIPGVLDSDDRKYMEIQSGKFQLKTSSDYQVHLVYYAISKPAKDYVMKLESNDGLIRFVDSDTVFVDTRYDEKMIRIRSNRLDETRNVSVRIKQLEAGADTNSLIAPSVDLEFRIRFRWFRASALAVLIAASMFAETYLSAIEGKFEGNVRIEVLVGMGALALLTSLFAVFGIRKYF